MHGCCFPRAGRRSGIQSLQVDPSRAAFLPTLVGLKTEEGPIRAFAFVIDRNNGRYVGGLSAEAVADVLAKAVGMWGSMADYLHKTVENLEALGIHDRQLWRLQEMVAERIEAMAVFARP